MLKTSSINRKHHRTLSKN